jgi:hypothetical protein
MRAEYLTRGLHNPLLPGYDDAERVNSDDKRQECCWLRFPPISTDISALPCRPTLPPTALLAAQIASILASLDLVC